MAELAGLILAAGTSSRMGAFKPMLQVDGQTMIRRVADMMRRAGAGPVVVVTGYRGEQLERHLAGLDIHLQGLREMGYTDADLARITTPIGLDIKAETPAEIAVSIAAQLISIRAENK